MRPLGPLRPPAGLKRAPKRTAAASERARPTANGSAELTSVSSSGGSLASPAAAACRPPLRLQLAGRPPRNARNPRTGWIPLFYCSSCRRRRRQFPDVASQPPSRAAILLPSSSRPRSGKRGYCLRSLSPLLRPQNASSPWRASQIKSSWMIVLEFCLCCTCLLGEKRAEQTWRLHSGRPPWNRSLSSNKHEQVKLSEMEVAFTGTKLRQLDRLFLSRPH